mgnify:CR=1 FL=1
MTKKHRQDGNRQDGDYRIIAYGSMCNLCAEVLAASPWAAVQKPLCDSEWRVASTGRAAWGR